MPSVNVAAPPVGQTLLTTSLVEAGHETTRVPTNQLLAESADISQPETFTTQVILNAVATSAPTLPLNSLGAGNFFSGSG